MLEVRNLTHVFSGGKVALKNINLKIQTGEFIILAGPNGAGKTVLVRHLNGLLHPTHGEVMLDGKPIQKDLLNARKKIGLIFQNPDRQIIGQTVREDIAFGPENLKLSRKEIDVRVQEVLEAVGLSHLAEYKPHLLSGGEKQRLAIAGVLAMRPSIIIFDEPFSNLDLIGVRQLLAQLLSLHRNGYTVIIVTHDVEKVIAHATRLIILQEGTIVKDGLPADLLLMLEEYQVKTPYLKDRDIRTLTWLN